MLTCIIAFFEYENLKQGDLMLVFMCDLLFLKLIRFEWSF